MILALVTDDQDSKRKFGINKILAAQEAEAKIHQHQRSIRTFSLPQIDFTAKDHSTFIPWDSIAKTEPPIFKSVHTYKTPLQHAWELCDT